MQPADPVTGNPVYNFALARVRLRDTLNANNVRVFFRIWHARQTNGEGQPIPVLGVQGDEVITIPFFAQARQTTSQELHLQVDDYNRHDIDASAGETDFFFGCWLDVNQPNDAIYPQRIVGVSADGPFDTVSPLFPIQQFMVAAHQCLIVEIAYDLDPIVAPADPSNSDKLAQRNLAFVGAPNPGNPNSRRVPQTFEVKPTLPKLPEGVKPDELMIDWDGTLGYAHPGLLTETLSLAPPRGHGVLSWRPWLTVANLEPLVRLQETFGAMDIDAIERLPEAERLRRNSQFMERRGFPPPDPTKP